MLVVLLGATLYVIPRLAPASATEQTIATAIGGPGEGSATDLGQEPSGIAARRTVEGKLNLYVADSFHNVVRLVDAESGRETVVAGGGGALGDGGSAVAAELIDPRGVAADDAGNIYIADAGHHRIRKVDPSGTITTIAGTGVAGYDGDCTTATSSCPAPLAMLNSPSAVALDSANQLYIADTGNHRIRKVSPSGNITTLAGNGSEGAFGDGVPASLAQLNGPRGVAADGASNIFIADTGNDRVRKVNTAGTISTVAGGGVLEEDGSAARAQLNAPHGVWAESGHLLIADTNNHRVRRVDASGNITTLAGDGVPGFAGDGGPAAAAKLSSPRGVTQSGNALIVADSGNYRVRKLEPGGPVSTIAGNGTKSYGGDGGPARSAQIFKPGGMTFTADGSLIFVDSANQRVRKVDASGVISTLAGTGTKGFSGDGGLATAAEIAFGQNQFGDVAVDADGSIYIADTGNHRVRKVDQSGTITTLAGTGIAGSSGDGGPATSANLSFPSGLHLTPAGLLLVAQADRANPRVRAIDTDGTISTFAGGGSDQFRFNTEEPAPGDGGPATGATLFQPTDVSGDRAGNVYVADSARVRRIDASGVITTLAGSGLTGDFGDGGPAVQAALNTEGIATDNGGTTFLTHRFLNGRVRKVDGAGTILAVAGRAEGEPGFAGDGSPATAARLSFPRRMAVDERGTLFIADTGNNRIRTVVGAGRTTPSSSVVDPSLQVSGIRPSAGVENGWTHVTITGSGFQRATGVRFGSAPASSFMVESDTIIHAASPPGTGFVELSVVSAVGESLKKIPFTYFEQSGTWAPTDPLLRRTTGQTATLLAGAACARSAPSVCGRVLVVGGADNGPITRSELYDATSGAWATCQSDSATSTCPGPLNRPRHGHTATLLQDGRVLVVGGKPAASLAGTGAVTDDTSSSAELYDPSTGRWTGAGRLSAPRAGGHTATLLPNGQVLVVSGPGGGGSAELFDPKTGLWTPVDSMASERYGHSATLLENGKILVAGGVGLSSAELYDPATRTWTPTASLSRNRGFHTATRLAGGKVLAVGGHPRDPSAEIYDPAADNGVGRWTPTGTPRGARLEHTSTLLATGEVLVVGGCCDPGDSTTERPVDSAELYDPKSGQFRQTTSLNEARRGASAVLLDNDTVLIAGGVLRSNTAPTASASEEVFTQTGVSRPPVIGDVNPPSGPTSGGTTVVVRGAGLSPLNMLHFGDRPASVRFVSDSYVVVASPSHSQGLADVVAVTAVGRSPRSQQAAFEFAAGTWSRAEALTSCASSSPESCVARYQHTATTLKNGKVLVTGGTKNMAPDGMYAWETAFQEAGVDSPPGVATTSRLGFVRKTAQLYDPVTGSWHATAPMQERRFQHSATLLNDGRVLVVGGQDEFGGAVATAEIYDPGSERWQYTQDMQFSPGRFAHTATLLEDGRVLVAGGGYDESSRPSVAVAEVFDPRSSEWTATAPMHSARQYHTATALPDGRVLVHGGLAQCPDSTGSDCSPDVGSPTSSGVLRSTEIFDARASGGRGGWSTVAPAAVRRFHHTATLLGGGRCGEVCGTVLVAGGTDAGGPLASAEVFDPRVGKWMPAASLQTARGGHSATLLPDGTVLVAGSGPPFHGRGRPLATTAAELYDPVDRTWRDTTWMSDARGIHTATLLDTDPCGANCGKVLVAGGGDLAFFGNNPNAIDGAELYTPAPRVSSVSPGTGRATGGDWVTIAGWGFHRVSGVMFGDTPAQSFTVEAEDRITAMTPVHGAGPVQVGVINEAGTSRAIVPHPAGRFVYAGRPGRIADLTATPDVRSVTLRFSSPDDGTTLGPATHYIIKQTPFPIDEAGFAAAPALCGGVCAVKSGALVELAVGDLEPDSTYHYAVQPLGILGDPGETAHISARTLPAPGGASATSCRAGNEPGPGQLAFPGGSYALVGLPDGSVLSTAAPLYSWLDQGAGGIYRSQPGGSPLKAGQGYWAWFACGGLATLGAGQASVSLPLGAYHASMAGNPSAVAPALVTGHDFAARWDAHANEGAGGYLLSSYREPQRLGLGEGTWVFSYVTTEISVEADRMNYLG